MGIIRTSCWKPRISSALVTGVGVALAVVVVSSMTFNSSSAFR